MAKGTAASCRLYILFARAAPVALIFRRGPSRWVRLILWNLRDDTYLPGQWFHGRLYESSCALTPDGRYFIYFAAKYSERRHVEPVMDAWTAISHPPYLTALALWPGEAIGTWKDNVVPYSEPGRTRPPFSLAEAKRARSHAGFAGADYATIRSRRHFDGWQLQQSALGLTFTEQNTIHFQQPAVWVKSSLDQSYQLVHTVFNSFNEGHSGIYRESFTLHCRASQTDHPFPKGTCWADWDARGRLVWVRQGELWSTTLPVETLDGDPFAQATLLADFTPMKPEGVAPPEWAKRW